MNCLDEILNCYEKKESFESQLIKSRINYILINLMEDLEDESSKNYLKVRNCLILLLHLFFETENPDYYHSIGIPIKEIPNKEKEIYIEILKSEVIL